METISAEAKKIPGLASAHFKKNQIFEIFESSKKLLENFAAIWLHGFIKIREFWQF